MRNYRNSFTNSNIGLPPTFTTSKSYFPNTPIQNSAFSAAHFDTLLTYRSYLLHEVKCVDIQIQRDSAEFNLMLHRLMEAQSILQQQREGLKDQLNARRGQLKVKQDSRENIELANINSIARTKQAVELQQKLARMHNTLKLQNQSFKTQLNRKNEDREAIIQKMRAKEKDYKQTTQDINSKNKEIVTGKQREKQLYQLEGKLKDEREIKVKCINSQSQKYIETVDKLRVQEQEKSYLQNVRYILKCKALQLQNRNIELGSKLESCRQDRIKLQNKEQQLNYSLQIALTQLQQQQRHRQTEEDKLKTQKQQNESNKQHLNKLKYYIRQLKQNNNIISKVMINFKKEDEVEIANILLKVKHQNNQYIKKSQFDRNIQKIDYIGQAICTSKIGKIQQSMNMDGERKGVNQRGLQIQGKQNKEKQNKQNKEKQNKQNKGKQNILKGYFKFCNIQHNGDYSDDNSPINEDKIEQTDNILEPQSKLNPNPNQNQQQQSTNLQQNPIKFPLFISTRPSHNCQFKTYRMPEQVSNIVNKFKPSTNSNILQSISNTNIQVQVQVQEKQNYYISAQNKFKCFGTMFGFRSLYGDGHGGYGRGVGESGGRVG